MWRIREHREVAKIIKKAPRQIQVNYLAWKRVVEFEGPLGLRAIKGFHDEALKGEWQGCRSSRLSKQWRVIYIVGKDEFIVYVIEVNPHTY